MKNLSIIISRYANKLRFIPAQIPGSIIYALALSLAIQVNSYAQGPVLPIGEFAVYSSGEVRFGSDAWVLRYNTSVPHGRVGSQTRIQTEAALNSQGGLHSNGTIHLGAFSTIGGQISAVNPGGVADTVLIVAGNSQVNGNIDVNGDITVVSTSILNGTVTYSGNYSGPMPTGGAGSLIQGPPNTPTLPGMPTPTTFPASGSVTINPTGPSAIITPGVYNDLILSGNKTIVFNGGGTYVFNRISYVGNDFNTLQFSFDHSNPSSGIYNIYVHQEMHVGRTLIAFGNTNPGGPALSTGEIARNIYWETHSNTSTNAFSLIGDNSSPSNPSTFIGTVYAPYGPIDFGNSQTGSVLIGALWGNGIRLADESQIYYAPLNNNTCNTTIMVDAGPNQTICGAGITEAHLTGLVTGATGGIWTGGSGTFSPNNTTLNAIYTPSPAEITAGTVTLTLTSTGNGACAAVADQVEILIDQPVFVADPGTVAACAYDTAVALATSTAGGALGAIWSLGTATGTLTQISPLLHIYTPSAAEAATTTPLSVTLLKYVYNTTCNSLIHSTPFVVTLTLNPSPTVHAGSDQVLCTGGTTALNATVSTASGPLLFNWSTFNGNIVSGQTSTQAIVDAGGTYTIEVTNMYGCVASDEVNVFIPTLSAGPIITAPDTLTICAPAFALASGVSLSATILNADSYLWSTSDGAFATGANLTNDTVRITAAGTYTITATNVCSGMFNAANITVISQSAPCITELITPPPADGKEENLIKGAELTSLAQAYLADPTLNLQELEDVLIINGDKVYIEVIAQPNQKASLLSILLGLGMTNVIDNGPGSAVISGLMPIVQLPNVDLINSQIVNYARPLFPALNNSHGINSPFTQGDAIMKTDLVRDGYGLDGSGIKIGVISDSYDFLGGAASDISGGNLPGAGNPNGHGIPVREIDLEPLRAGTDEGRAMLQIIHDIAPKAELMFRTGCRTSGDMAEGIKQLQQAGCQIIVDDLTHITEPFYKDGQIARAVDFVAERGVSYFTAAGNFGSSSYEGTLNNPLAITPAVLSTLPASMANLTGHLYDFGGGNHLQDVTLKAGAYIVVLQWDDAIYTNGQLDGTQSDFDMYLVYDNVVDNDIVPSVIAYNRTNFGGDPLEVLTFKVTADGTPARLLINRASGNATRFKYIVFRGDMALAGSSLTSSTVIGHANAAGAITVGAVRPPASLEADIDDFLAGDIIPMNYTSKGGTPVDGISRLKPEFTAPNGVLTTVQLGLPKQGQEPGYRFYGTSAAAPHAAAVGALLMQGRATYLGQQTTSPTTMRSMLKTGLSSNHSPITGFGLINAQAAMQSFANPKPAIANVLVPFDFVQNFDPGAEVEVAILGSGYIPESVVKLNGQPIAAAKIVSQGPSQIVALISPLSATDEVMVSNPSITQALPATDGGNSNAWVLGSEPKTSVTVAANDQSKKYGQSVPELTYTLFINGEPQLTVTPALLEEYGIAGVTLEAMEGPNTPVSALSAVNTLGYPIIATIQPTSNIGNNSHETRTGLLKVEKLPLRITPQAKTVTYGDRIENIALVYEFDESVSQNEAALLALVQNQHQTQLTSETAVVNTRVSTDMATLVNDYYVDNLAFLTSGGSLSNTRVSTDMATLVNGEFDLNAQAVVDLPAVSLIYFRDISDTRTPMVNTRVSTDMATLVNTRVSTDMATLVNAGPLVESNITNTRVSTDMATLVNTSTENWVLENSTSNTLLNSSTTYNGNGKSNVALIVHRSDIDMDAGSTAASLISGIKSINVITGYTPGTHYIMPGALLSPNLDITYSYGMLTVNQAPLSVKADAYVFKGDAPAAITYIPSATGWVGYDKDSIGLQGLSFSHDLNPATPAIDLYTTTTAANKYPGAVNVTGGSTDPDYYQIVHATPKGNFFVNPKGIGAKQIRPYLKCVSDSAKVTPNGTFEYVAHLEYINENSTPVFLPTDHPLMLNYISADGRYYAKLPQEFKVGTHPVDVPFDGEKLNWTIKTFTASLRSATASDASANSNRCAAQSRSVQVNEPQLSVYPNPTSSAFTVKLQGFVLAPDQVQVFDMLGRQVNVAATPNAGLLELDLGSRAAGVYTVRVKVDSMEKVLRLMKE